MITGKIRKLLCYSLAIGGIMLTFSFWGCSKKTNDVDNNESAYSKIVAMTDEDRQQYVKDYLLEQYDLECDVSKLRHRQETAIHNEKNMFATATTPDGFCFSVWLIPHTGEIVDTSFTYFLKDDINDYIEGLLTAAGYECRVNSRYDIYDFSEEKYDESSIPQMLSSGCGEIVIEMKVLSPYPDIEEISDILAGINGIAYVHVVDNLDDEVSKNYDYSITLGKN